MVDDLHQAFACFHQTGKDFVLAFSGRFFRGYRNLQSFFDPDACGQIIESAGEWGAGRDTVLFSQHGCEAVAYFVFSVYDEYHLRRRLECSGPVEQSVLIGVSADSFQLDDLCFDLNRLAEDLYIFRALQQRTSQCIVCLISHEEDGGFRPPEVVLQMMLDTAGFAHA